VTRLRCAVTRFFVSELKSRGSDAHLLWYFPYPIFMDLWLHRSGSLVLNLVVLSMRGDVSASRGLCGKLVVDMPLGLLNC
jgi:hypothetical protein